MNLCKDCEHWGKIKDRFLTIDARPCSISPADTDDMKANSFAIACGHDGPIFCGADFGCINFEGKVINEPA